MSIYFTKNVKEIDSKDFENYTLTTKKKKELDMTRIEKIKQSNSNENQEKGDNNK